MQITRGLSFYAIVSSLFTIPCAYSSLPHEPSTASREFEPRSPQLASPQASTSATTLPKESWLRFSSPAAQQFYVDGRTIPFVEWDAGPSYAGLLPVSDAPTETRKLFFWFWPAASQIGVNDLMFFTNGGPGCSSLESLLQETGPISWKFGQARPTRNPHSWTNATSMIWVEHPVGTGYSEGIPQAINQTDVSRDLFGFFTQWLRVFPEMANKNFYLSGESYAGYYIPYFADYIYARQMEFGLRLMGIYLVNPTISWLVLHEQIPVVPLVKQYEHVFAFNKTFMAQIEFLHKQCGYENYLTKYAVYPPPTGPFPIPAVGLFPENGVGSDPRCDIFSKVLQAAKLGNPAFNIYQIFDLPPSSWDVLDAPQRWPGMTGDAVYFNRQDVKRVLHVPLTTQWTECHPGVFPKGDQSMPSALTVLPSVINRSRRSVIASGKTDFVMINDGLKLILQNMTWGNPQMQGFQYPIQNDFIISGQGASGQYCTERGLTLVQLEKCGHMVPQYQPEGAFQILQYLLGQTNSPSAAWPS